MNHQSRSSLIDDLNRSVRENPAAAGLIGLGVAWMLFGRSNLMAIGNYAPRAVNSAARAASSAAGSAARAVSSGVGYASRAVGEGMDSAASGLSDAAESVKDGISKATGWADESPNEFAAPSGKHSSDGQTPEAGHSMMTALQRNLGDALERQPILLGTIGLALGAGIACALPSTAVERRLLADKSAALKDRMGDMVHETVEQAADRIEHVSKTVKEEAGRQVAALKGDLSQTADKLAAVASTAKSSAKRRRSKET